MLITLCNHNAGQALTAANIHHRMAQMQGNAIIVQALFNIARQSAGIRLHFVYPFDMRPFQRHAPGHNQTDIPAAEDDHLMTDHDVLQINVILRNAGRINPCRPGARRCQRTPGAFTASHGQQHGICLNFQQTVHAAGRRNNFFL